MNLGIEGKRALVLGGNKGLGRGVATRLAAEGAVVAAVGRDAAALDATVADLRGVSPSSFGIHADLENPADVAAMIAQDEGVEDQWNEARATNEETFVKLPRKIPVRLLYNTVLFDPSGAPIVRNDPYGWDDRVGAALGFKAGHALLVKSQQADIGP